MKKNTKTTLAVIVVGIVVCTVLRLISILAFTDMKTGFLYHGSEGIGAAYYIVMAAFVIAAAVAAAHDEKGGFGEREIADITGKKAVVIGFAALLISFCAFFEGLRATRLLTTPRSVVLLNLVFAVYICIVAFVTLYKKRFTPGLGFAYSFFGVFFLMRGISCFSQRMVITGIIEYLTECMIPACGAVSFVIFAKFFSGNMSKRTRKAMCFWGGASAIMSFSTGIAVVAAKLFATEEIKSRIVLSELAAQTFYQSHQGVEPYAMRFPSSVNIALGIFCITIIVVMLLPAEKIEQTEQTENTSDDGQTELFPNPRQDGGEARF